MSGLDVASCSTFGVILKMSVTEPLNAHQSSFPCDACGSSCPLLNCTASALVRSREQELFCSHSMFHGHKHAWLMSDGKLHFWGGATVVGPIFCDCSSWSSCIWFKWQLPLRPNGSVVWGRETREKGPTAIQKNVPVVSWAPESNILYISHLDRKLR